MIQEWKMRAGRTVTTVGHSVCAVLAVAALSLPSSARATELDFTDSAWSRAAAPHGLDPALLYALTLVESRRTVAPEMIAPWPWVIRTPTGGYWFNSRDRAERGLEAVLAKWPAKRVDVGIAADAIDSTRDTVLGVGRYHHWASEPRSRAYGQRVWWTYRDVTFGDPNPAHRFLLATEADLAPVAAELAGD
jgi:hypothetical protein